MGLVFGKMVGEIEDVNPWILGVTGGFFLYIALTNKVGKVYWSVHSQNCHKLLARCQLYRLIATCQRLQQTIH